MQQSTGSIELTANTGETAAADLGTDDRPSRSVVETITATEDIEQTDLPPLYTVIDPDALDTLFESQAGSEEGRTPTEVQFTYFGYEVTVSDAGVSISEQ